MPTTGRHSTRRRQLEQGGRLYPEVPFVDIEMRDLNEQGVLTIHIYMHFFIINSTDKILTTFFFQIAEMEISFSKGKYWPNNFLKPILHFQPPFFR